MTYIRVFGSNQCEKCAEVISTLDLVQASYSFIDAFADDMQDLCDAEDIDEDLPFLQIVSAEGSVYHDGGDDIDIGKMLEQYVSHGGILGEEEA